LIIAVVNAVIIRTANTALSGWLHNTPLTCTSLSDGHVCRDGWIAWKVGPSGDIATSAFAKAIAAMDADRNKGKVVASGYYSWYKGESMHVLLQNLSPHLICDC
jgi:hypothetical protein